MKSKKGFTLIELLVVVLIIGILAAIAVPQYKKAVLKSRATQMMSLVRAIANAEEAYYLANGKYSRSFEELDISMPPNSSQCVIDSSPMCKKYDDWEIIAYGSPAQSIEALYQNTFKITHYLKNARAGNYIRENSGDLTCLARSADFEKGKALCQSLGGTQIGDDDHYYRL